MNKYFKKDELLTLGAAPIPSHIAMIIDGNRRWAKKQSIFKQLSEGHHAGAKNLLEIVLAAKELKIKVLTAFGFSTENWSRPQGEIDTLIQIFESFVKEQRQKMADEGVRFSCIGDLSRFPLSLQNEILKTKEATAQCKEIDFVVALNYGGRDEIRRSIQKIIESGVGKEQVTEKLVASYLDTAHFGDPELLIRPGGEMRVSNFLLWQLAYCEIYVTEVLWPDFSPQDLLRAIKTYQTRERRQGK